IERAAADVDPVGLRHVPSITRHVVEQHELRLAVATETRSFDGGRIGLELELLGADGTPWPHRREHARNRAVRATGTDDVTRAQRSAIRQLDRPAIGVGTPFELLDGNAEQQLRSRPTQQEIVELEAADEPAL